METMHLIGRDPDNLRVVVSIRLTEEEAKPRETVEHDTITGPIMTLGITLNGLARHRHDIEYGGQAREGLDTLSSLQAGWTEADIASLRTIWEEWHLNNMRAACAHMELPEDTSYDARQDITCPITGYKYGRSWLTKVIPDDVIAEVHRLQALPYGDIPEWLWKG